MRFVLVALALLTAAPALASEKRSPEEKDLPKPGTPYRAARAQMIRLGIDPGPVPPNAEGCGIGWEDVCATFPETVACRGTGLAGCEYMFRKAGWTYIITTSGEEIDAQRVKRARRVWTNDMPGMD